MIGFIKKLFLSKNIILLTFYLFIFAFLIYNSYGYLDPDLGWHLRVGQEIYEEKAAPGPELYTTTLSGENWVDHEWLFNLLMYIIYLFGGYLTLSLFFAFLVIIVFLLQIYLIKKYFIKKSGLFWIMFFQFLGVLAMSPHLGIRVQEIALINLTLLLIIIFHFIKNHNYRTLLWLAPLFLFWVNVHGSFLIGLFVLISFFCYLPFIRFLKKTRPRFIPPWLTSNPEITTNGFYYLGGILALVLLTTLINPYGFKLYSFLGDYADTVYMKHIVEWLPAHHWPIQFKQLIYSAIVVAVSFLCLYNYQTRNLLKSKQNINLWLLLLSGLFLVLSFRSKRHFPLFYVVSFPLALSFSTMLFDALKAWHFKTSPCFTKVYLSATLVLLAVFYFATTNYTPDPFSNKKFCLNYPCQAVEFLKTQDNYQDYIIFNPYNAGGFLVWAWPEKKIFIDGRLPQYKYGHHTFLQEYYEFFAENKAREKLDQHEINLVMLSSEKRVSFNWFEKKIFGLDEKRINDQPNHLKDYLAIAPNWQLVFEDSASLIYERIEEF